MLMSYTIEDLKNIAIDIHAPAIIFLYWDLWSWKTTLSSLLIQKLLGKSREITSPTYVYYNRYDDIYHFDLYRLESYDQFISIWWEEILDNNSWVVFIEWPELLEKYYNPDIKIYLKKTDIEDLREVEILYVKNTL